MGKIKELLYKEQNPEMFEEEAFEHYYEPPWAGDIPDLVSHLCFEFILLRVEL